jgi:hypothetical protein
MTARERILVACNELWPDELEVLAMVAAGLVRGRELYGELDLEADQRHFDREALEEVRDALVYALVYAGAALVRRSRGLDGRSVQLRKNAG